MSLNRRRPAEHISYLPSITNFRPYFPISLGTKNTLPSLEDFHF